MNRHAVLLISLVLSVCIDRLAVAEDVAKVCGSVEALWKNRDAASLPGCVLKDEEDQGGGRYKPDAAAQGTEATLSDAKWKIYQILAALIRGEYDLAEQRASVCAPEVFEGWRNQPELDGARGAYHAYCKAVLDPMLAACRSARGSIKELASAYKEALSSQNVSEQSAKRIDTLIDEITAKGVPETFGVPNAAADSRSFAEVRQYIASRRAGNEQAPPRQHGKTGRPAPIHIAAGGCLHKCHECEKRCSSLDGTSRTACHAPCYPPNDACCRAEGGKGHSSSCGCTDR